MSTRSVKGYRTRTVMKNGKMVQVLEKVQGYGLDTSAKIRQRKSKRVKPQHPMLAGLFSPRGK